MLSASLRWSNIYMRLNIKNTLVTIFIAFALFTGGYVLGQSSIAPWQLFDPIASTPAKAEAAFQPLWETWRLLQTEYFDQPLDNIKLADGAIEGMLAALGDPNTRYLPPEQEQAARQSFQGNLEGIGAEISSQDGVIVIIAPYEGSPAAAAGLRPGDVLLEANGIALTGMDPSEAGSIVRGPAGTIVHLQIERNGEILEFDITRDLIRISSVNAELLENGIAYIRLSRFATGTDDELERALKDLMPQDPIGVILDLRSNPGGSLTSAVDVADQFLADGLILSERFGNGQIREFQSGSGEVAEEAPLVVLIDGGSASASEVVAGAVQDNGRGILIGATSFGKGTVQTWKRLGNGGGVRITTARWLTPEGTWIHKDGLLPDILVSLPDTVDGEFDDKQLQAAIDHILDLHLIDSGAD